MTYDITVHNLNFWTMRRGGVVAVDQVLRPLLLWMCEYGSRYVQAGKSFDLI